MAGRWPGSCITRRRPRRKMEHSRGGGGEAESGSSARTGWAKEARARVSCRCAPGDARLESRHAESRRGSACGRDAHQPSRVVPSRQALPFTKLCVLVARPANEPPQAGEPMCNKKPPEDEREETELDAALQAVELLHNTAQPVRTSDGRQHTPSAARRVRTRDTTRRRAPKGVLACRGSEDE